MFQRYYEKKVQSQSFSGAGEQNYTAKSKRDIITIVNMDRTSMVHVPNRWKDRGVDDLLLCAFAVGCIIRF